MATPVEISAIVKFAGIVIHSLSGGLYNGQKNRSFRTSGSNISSSKVSNSTTRGSQSPTQHNRPRSSKALVDVTAQHTTRARGKQVVQTCPCATTRSEQACRVQLTSSGLKQRATTALVQSHRAHARRTQHLCDAGVSDYLGQGQKFRCQRAVLLTLLH